MARLTACALTQPEVHGRYRKPMTPGLARALPDRGEKPWHEQG